MLNQYAFFILSDKNQFDFVQFISNASFIWFLLKLIVFTGLFWF